MKKKTEENTEETPAKVPEHETGEQAAKTEEQETAQGQQRETSAEANAKAAATNAEDAERVDALLRMYPQYQVCYVSKEGFVYPEHTPKYQRGDAVLYRNKHYKQ